jgi:hypothetical protein
MFVILFLSNVGVLKGVQVMQVPEAEDQELAD